MNSRTNGAPDLPADEMAFRKIYRHLLNTQKLTTVFRPGDRKDSSWRGYSQGDMVRARVIENVGADWSGIGPTFLSESYKIKIDRVQVLRLSEITDEHLRGTSDDISDTTALVFHLGTIYNLPIEEFKYTSEVTRISFSYMPND